MTDGVRSPFVRVHLRFGSDGCVSARHRVARVALRGARSRGCQVFALSRPICAGTAGRPRLVRGRSSSTWKTCCRCSRSRASRGPCCSATHTGACSRGASPPKRRTGFPHSCSWTRRWRCQQQLADAGDLRLFERGPLLAERGRCIPEAAASAHRRACGPRPSTRLCLWNAERTASSAARRA